jgi:putative flippase GtrA
MKKKNIIIVLLIGEAIALFGLTILRNMDVMGMSWLNWALPVIFPFITLFCFWVAYVLGKKFLFIFQLAKFGLVGALNTFVDLGILSILMAVSGVASGLAYSVFKGISFIGATTNSYFWNKLWTFEKKKSQDAKKEFLQFLIVSGVGFAINVGVAYFVVNMIGPKFGLSAQIWGMLGAVVAAFGAMTWNFLGYKFIVFKK